MCGKLHFIFPQYFASNVLKILTFLEKISKCVWKLGLKEANKLTDKFFSMYHFLADILLTYLHKVVQKLAFLCCS